MTTKPTRFKEATRKAPRAYPSGKHAQIAMEYLATYGWAILIGVVAISLIYFYLIAPNIIAPSSCIFSIGVSCSDMAATTNGIAGNTVLTVSLQNAQQFPITNPTMFYNINGTNSSALPCTSPSMIYNPGNTIICQATLPMQAQAGTLIYGKIYVNASYCGLLPSFNFTSPSCSGAPKQTYVGTFNTHVG